MKNKDTIFALSTPPGKSAIAVIRISGPKSIYILKKITKLKNYKKKSIMVAKIYNTQGEEIDKAVTAIYKNPKTYTGEDVLEIFTHGSSAVVKKLLLTLGSINGCRIAKPGEFTRRAFENNKLDLTQVEAIADLVNSETEAQRRQATSHLSGSLSKKTKKWSKEILIILSNIEAIIDFSDQNLPSQLVKKIKEQTRNTIKSIEEFINDGGYGEKIRAGFEAAVIGGVNTGKSTFVNYLAKRDLSIVTNEPGTTRDVIELFYDLRGIPIKFYDTAGFRDPKNRAEKAGINKSLLYMKKCDIRLIFISKENEITNYDTNKKNIFIISKLDIKKSIKKSKKIIYISGKNGKGVTSLLKKIYTKIQCERTLEDANVSRERQRHVLTKTIKNLKNSLNDKNIDIIAEDIRLANKEITNLTGNNDIEDVLEIIFNEFCIGK